MKIKIDGKELTVKDENKNIVEIAKENGINILAPCYRANQKHGCCNACVIEIDGKQEYACVTKPLDGMDITYDREDLEELRKDRLEFYAENIRLGKDNPCSYSCNCGSGCGSDCC